MGVLGHTPLKFNKHSSQGPFSLLPLRPAAPEGVGASPPGQHCPLQLVSLEFRYDGGDMDLPVASSPTLGHQ